MIMKLRNREKDVKANNISIVFLVFWYFESLDKSRIPWCAFCCFIEIPDEKLPRDLAKASWLSVVKWKLTFSGKKWKLTFSGKVKVYFQWKSENLLSVEKWKLTFSRNVKVFFKWKSESFLSVGKWKLTNAGERESQLCLISLELCKIPMHWFQIQHLPQPPSCLFLNHHSSYPTILRSFKMSTREWHISDESRFVFHLHIVSFVGLYKLEKITVFMKPELLYSDIEKITLEVKV